eukprot:COSAG05_NODE_11604_length_505_cov_1.268473_1_plen_136_part_10
MSLTYQYDLNIIQLITIPSRAVPYQSITQYTRALTNNISFTETFSGIPPSVTAIVVGMRKDAHRLDVNRDLYEAGGSGSNFSFKTFHVSVAYPRSRSNNHRGRAKQDGACCGGNASGSCTATATADGIHLIFVAAT